MPNKKRIFLSFHSAVPAIVSRALPVVVLAYILKIGLGIFLTWRVSACESICPELAASWVVRVNFAPSPTVARLKWRYPISAASLIMLCTLAMLGVVRQISQPW
ncbi:Uncharacterised protein [Vibrio cholerae]|nr:hypothetical protein DN33_3691 [Vibrio cholerae]CSB29461.1 Uncharacterised protein [Vibrio cholerae]CSD61803.1 Uncharacterised protein [Vibrio cholerae]